MARAEEIEIYNPVTKQIEKIDRVQKTDAEWKKELSPEVYDIIRKQGTECAFTGEHYDNHDKGYYQCAGCGLYLYSSDDKFESGTGWPSFTQAVDDRNIATASDNTHFMQRTELLCPRCGAHLGHVFDDGPGPKGQRHCINSAALNFAPLKRNRS